RGLLHFCAVQGRLRFHDVVPRAGVPPAGILRRESVGEGMTSRRGSQTTASRRRRISPWLFLLIPLAAAVPLIPYGVEVSHFAVSMFMQTVTYAIAVLGMVVVLGYTGQINLAQAAFFGFGAYGVALGTVAYGLPFWVSLGLGIGVAAIAGGILGL